MAPKRKESRDPSSSTKRTKIQLPHDELILSMMLSRDYRLGHHSVKVATLEQECRIGARNKSFRAEWNAHIEKGNIVKAASGGGQLSAEGEALAENLDTGTTKPMTNREHQDMIKSKLRGKGPEMVDLLLEAPMNRKELAAELGYHVRSHEINDGAKDLLDLGYAELGKANARKLVLTRRSFFTDEAKSEYDAKIEASKAAGCSRIKDGSPIEDSDADKMEETEVGINDGPAVAEVVDNAKTVKAGAETPPANVGPPIKLMKEE